MKVKILAEVDGETFELAEASGDTPEAFFGNTVAALRAAANEIESGEGWASPS